MKSGFHPFPVRNQLALARASLKNRPTRANSADEKRGFRLPIKMKTDGFQTFPQEKLRRIKGFLCLQAKRQVRFTHLPLLSFLGVNPGKWLQRWGGHVVYWFLYVLFNRLLIFIFPFLLFLL